MSSTKEWLGETFNVSKWGAHASGALFGLGWYAWVDAVTYTSAMHIDTFKWTYLIPGLIATLAMLLISLVPRDDSSSYVDDQALCRTRFWLFVGYTLSFGAIGSAIVFLALDKQQGVENLWVSIAGIVQSFLIALSGLMMWLSKAEEDSGYAYL